MDSKNITGAEPDPPHRAGTPRNLKRGAQPCRIKKMYEKRLTLSLKIINILFSQSYRRGPMSLNKTTKRLCIIAVIALVAFFFATPAAWAAEEAAEAAKSGGRDSMVLAVIFITAGFGVVLGAVF